jgi:hypothetical protein
LNITRLVQNHQLMTATHTLERAKLHQKKS